MFSGFLSEFPSDIDAFFPRCFAVWETGYDAWCIEFACDVDACFDATCRVWQSRFCTLCKAVAVHGGAGELVVGKCLLDVLEQECVVSELNGVEVGIVADDAVQFHVLVAGVCNVLEAVEETSLMIDK